MNNPEKLATYSTQDTGQINVRENEGEIKMNNPEKLATYSTQDTGQINVREHRRGNQNEQSRETGNI
jgi:lipocalin